MQHETQTPVYSPALIPKQCFTIAVIFTLHQMQLHAKGTSASLGVTADDLKISEAEFAEFEFHMRALLNAKHSTIEVTPEKTVGQIYEPRYPSKDDAGERPMY